MEFSFETSARILFGPGLRHELEALVLNFGRSPLIVTGRDSSRADFLLEKLKSRGIEPLVARVHREPTVEDATRFSELARAEGRDVVVAVGGGSVMDAGKAIAALVANPGHPLEYLEVVGAGRPLTQRSLPLLAVPTTAGTGAEVTKNAVLDVPEKNVKVSLRSSSMLPSVALLDPELTLSVPPDITRATGFDALTQVIEPFLSCAANPVTDAICREGITRGISSLERVCQEGRDLEARENMMMTSLFGGMALANAKLGAVHGIAGPLGGVSHAPHGALCAALLPSSLRVNLRALRARGEPKYLDRFRALGALLMGQRDATADDAVRAVEELASRLGVLSLSALGISRETARGVIPMALRASSMKGNPIVLSEDELGELIESA